MRLPANSPESAAESLVQPDGLIRVLDAGPATWLERHKAPTKIAWWVEVDRGTEDQPDWVKKINRFARALRAQAWQQVSKCQYAPGLLVTVAEGTLLSRALWISHAAAVERISPDWPIWIAEHRLVASAETIEAPVWRQIFIQRESNERNVLADDLWSLSAIINPQQPYPATLLLQQAREREREVQRKKAQEVEEYWQRKKQAEEQAKAEIEKERQRLANRLASDARAAEMRRADEEWRQQQQARIDELKYQQQLAAERAQRRSFAGRVDSFFQGLHAIGAWWSNLGEGVHKFVGWSLFIVAAVALWLWLYFSSDPTIDQITESVQYDGRSPFLRIPDYVQSPQTWMLCITLLAVLWFISSRFGSDRA